MWVPKDETVVANSIHSVASSQPTHNATHTTHTTNRENGRRISEVLIISASEVLFIRALAFRQGAASEEEVPHHTK